MNQADKQRLVNKNLQFIRFSNRSGSHCGCVRYHKQNTYRHEDCKWAICKMLAKAGHEFITEGIFGNGARSDVFVLDKSLVIEILETETIKEYQEKIKKYPKNLGVMAVTPENWKKELAFLEG